jgi:glycosyltransferase involved in cell wall biosynthesis
MHLIDSLAPGGAERMAVVIANHTDKEKYRVTVCVSRVVTVLKEFLNQDVHLFVLGRRSRWDIKKLIEFISYCRNEHVNVIHAHGNSSYNLAFLSRLLGNRVKIVLHEHLNNMELQNVRFFPEKTLLRLGRPWYVSVDPALSEWAVISGVPRDRVQPIINALDVGRYIEIGSCLSMTGDRVDSKPPLHGVMVANIRPEKNIELLIQAISRLKHYNFRVSIFGALTQEEYVSRCKRLISDLGVENRIQLMGTSLNVPSLLKTTDFALLSSKSESGPLALIEYMAAGLPFIATKVGSISRRAAELGVQEFVPPGDMDAFAEALERLLKLSPEERKARGRIGQEVALQHFDIRQVMSQWYEVYEKALAT